MRIYPVKENPIVSAVCEILWYKPCLLFIAFEEPVDAYEVK